MTLGLQKPAWHLPIPALVRRFTPSRLFAPGVRRIASMISPYVTDSQRQTMLP